MGCCAVHGLTQSGGIGDRVFVEKRFRIRAREPFNQRQVLAGIQQRPPDLVVFPVEVGWSR